MSCCVCGSVQPRLHICQSVCVFVRAQTGLGKPKGKSCLRCCNSLTCLLRWIEDGRWVFVRFALFSWMLFACGHYLTFQNTAKNKKERQWKKYMCRDLWGVLGEEKQNKTKDNKCPSLLLLNSGKINFRALHTLLIAICLTLYYYVW